MTGIPALAKLKRGLTISRQHIEPDGNRQSHGISFGNGQMPKMYRSKNMMPSGKQRNSVEFLEISAFQIDILSD
jgi:hypothetical protein